MWSNRLYQLRKWWKLWLVLITVLAVSALMVFLRNSWKYRAPSHWDYMDIEELYVWEGTNSSFRIKMKDMVIEYEVPEKKQKATFSEEEKKELIALLEKYKFLEWQDESYYIQKWNTKLYYSERTGDPYSLNEFYMGVGAYETRILGNYSGKIRYARKLNRRTESLSFGQYGLPDGYNELLDDLWEFVFRHDLEDERITLEERIKGTRFVMSPDKGEEKPGIPDSGNIWYFSFHEFFGGQEYGPGTSIEYADYDNESIQLIERTSYTRWTTFPGYNRVLNFVNKNGVIERYREKNDWWEERWSEKSRGYTTELMFDEEGEQKLMAIIEKYDIASWKDAEYYQNQPQPTYIQEGEFFHLNPRSNELGLSELEHEVRSTFECFIYLYDREGRRLKLRYDNTGLPENYNEFRKELWDCIDDINRKSENYYDGVDWRTQLDDWGKHYLELRKERESMQ